uniref:Uncharacterized protein n=1 Tax=Panagrolaimus sp. ES5 TaxID=591445 RepID=A0AC34GQQ1_9BILA
MSNIEPLPSTGSTDYQVVLVLEMIVLIAGETGLGILHGWTEGVGYAMKPYYTPMWVISWPVAVCLTIGAMAGGAPFLVGFLIFLYFTALLGFAYIYNSAEWKSTDLPSI